MFLIDSATNIINNFFKKIFSRFDFSAKYISNPVLQRWFVAVILCAILSFLLSPDLHLYQPVYELGRIAPKNIKADRDFPVEDHESTRQKKDDAAGNIRPVYDYDSNVPLNIKAKLAKAFVAADNFQNALDEKGKRTIPNAGKDIKTLKKNIEMIMGISLSPDEFNSLHQRKFSDELLTKLTRLIISFYESRLITNAVFAKNEKDKGIAVRDVKNQEGQEIRDLTAILNINDINTVLSRRINVVFKDDDKDLRRVMFSLTKKLIEPNLTFNKDATEKKRNAAREEVKIVFFQVQKNEMIVREGEKIGPLEVTKLAAFYKAAGDSKFSGIAVLLGIFLTSMFMAVVLFYWRSRNWSKEPERSNIEILFFGILIILQILLVKIGIFLSFAVNRAFPLTLSVDACYYAIPFAFGPMVIAVLINRNIALLLSIFSSFLIAFLFDEKVFLPIFAFLGSVAASYQIVNSRQRSAFIKVGIFLGLLNMAAVVCLNLVTGNLFNDLFARLLMGLAGGIVTGIIVAGITPVFESMFGFITDIKLLELANLNQPIFQQMIIEAPGTYHHSIIVASLVEAASEAIGANSLLAKVSAYYHDIGKLNKSQYFIENQATNENKHDKLSPKMSSLVIISHVKEGCEMASEIRLGKEIKNIIREHHGTSIVSYFYDKAKKDKDESIRSLSESDFRYPGPKPQSREAGLVMLGDIIEASSRTLSNPTPSRIRSLVLERIEKAYADGQLSECALTVKDLDTIADTFTRILNGIFHHRIDYPDQPGKETNGKKEINENSDRKQPE